MGRRNRDRVPQSQETWSGERTLADAESDTLDTSPASDLACICGSTELLLEAYLRVENGQLDPEPVEVETLTCPECGREYEAVLAEGGRVLRGEFQGFISDEDA